jgi:branched-chain amino acid transport system ATP-binding protein
MALLELQDIHKSYGSIRVLTGIDLVVEPGERHAIIGPNGAGKSTLFSIISGQFAQNAGTIVFDGQDISGLSARQIVTRGIARGFQIINVFPELTVFENIRAAVIARLKRQFSITRPVSRFDQAAAEAEASMRAVHLVDRRDELANKLSYGDQRRLEIALVHALKPKLMLLDEPCAGLNPGDTRQAVVMIKEITRDCTLLMVEHDMDVVFGLADRVTVIHYGKVLASGAPESIRQDATVKEAYLGRSAHAARGGRS